MDIKHSYIFVSLSAYFNICFLLMQDFHLRGRQLSLWVYLCVHFNKLVLEAYFKAERSRCFPFAMKILEGTIAASPASLNSNRTLAVKASWCLFSRIPVAWLLELRLGDSFILKVDCGTQCEESVKKAVLPLPSPHLYVYV